MREVMEALLRDVDPDIRDLMEREPAFQPMLGAMTMTPGGAIEEAKPMKNWELLPDPFFLIISWQRMRHENRHVKTG